MAHISGGADDVAVAGMQRMRDPSTDAQVSEMDPLWPWRHGHTEHLLPDWLTGLVASMNHRPLFLLALSQIFLLISVTCMMLNRRR